MHRLLAFGGVLTLAVGVAPAELIYGVTLQNTLVSWDSATPGTFLSGAAISGLSQNEVVRGIDFRPATGELMLLGSFSRVYTVSTASGVATPVSAGPFAPALNGAQFGFDFNPTVDRIRVVSDTEQNLRLNPSTGALAATDTNLAYAGGDPGFGVDPDVVHAAYTNNFSGAASTTLYVMDAGHDVLAIQNPPNNGTLNTVGALGINISEYGGFDISGATGNAYAALQSTSEFISRFYTVNLGTGAVSQVGEIGAGELITAMTVVPAPGALGLAGAALLLAQRRRR